VVNEELNDFILIVGSFLWLAVEGLIPVSILMFVIAAVQWVLAFRSVGKAPQHYKLIQVPEVRIALRTTCIALGLFVLGVIALRSGFLFYLREEFHAFEHI